MKVIYKHELQITDHQEPIMHQDAQILHVDIQYGIMCLWTLEDKDNIKVPRRIRILGTGHYIDDSEGLVYIGTCVTAEDTLVWHVFEELIPLPYNYGR